MNVPKVQRKWRLFYGAVAILEIASEVYRSAYQTKIGVYCFKPLLMPALMAYFYFTVYPKMDTITRLLLASLFFAFVGDVLLMLPVDAFIGGLAAFLVAHLLYISIFWKENRGFPQTSWTTLLTRLMLLLFPAALLFAEMQNNLNDLTLPVILYILVIVTMVLTSWLRREYQSLSAYFLSFLGALLFMFSDATIAYNKFIQPFAYANVLIMATYIAGQFLIVEGIIRSEHYADYA